MMLIRAYRVRGHLEANLDPLDLKPRHKHSELDPRSYGFSDADMDREIYIDNVFGYQHATLRQIVHAVRETYCGSIGVEYMHIENPEQKKWLQARIEGSRNQREFTPRGKQAILERLTAAEMFEKFLDKKYTGTKRFGLDGGESMIPALEQIIKRGSQLGVKEVVIGMTHRGRLNVLANFMNKRFAAIFSEFQGNAANPEDVQGSADVKYHLGTSADREFDGRVVHLSLTANPSHLECVNTVVLGKVRAKQDQRKDKNREQVMGLLLHGDASFAGQGLVPESARSLRARRLQDRRHHPFHRQQPDRLHHQPGGVALRSLLLGHRQGRAGADLPCERRRSGGGAVLRRPGRRVLPGVQARRGPRPVLLSPLRP